MQQQTGPDFGHNEHRKKVRFGWGLPCCSAARSHAHAVFSGAATLRPHAQAGVGSARAARRLRPAGTSERAACSRAVAWWV
jgi:hypothetical protein